MKDNKHCRNCGHLWDEHPAGTVDNETFIVIWIMVEPVKPTKCRCKKFYPMSNLEYLEWKHGHKK